MEQEPELVLLFSPLDKNTAARLQVAITAAVRQQVLWSLK